MRTDTNQPLSSAPCDIEHRLVVGAAVNIVQVQGFAPFQMAQIPWQRPWSAEPFILADGARTRSVGRYPRGVGSPAGSDPG